MHKHVWYAFSHSNYRRCLARATIHGLDHNLSYLSQLINTHSIILFVNDIRLWTALRAKKTIAQCVEREIWSIYIQAVNTSTITNSNSKYRHRKQLKIESYILQNAFGRNVFWPDTQTHPTRIYMCFAQSLPSWFISSPLLLRLIDPNCFC